MEWQEPKVCIYDFNEIDILLEAFCAGENEEELIKNVLDVYGNQIIEERFEETLASLKNDISLHKEYFLD